MELKLGKMTTKELAQWFGISYGSFRTMKAKKMEELKDFCFFEEVYGGINITAIVNPIYVKNGQKIREVYQQGFEELRQPIDTVTNINEKIFDKYHEQLPTLSSAASGYHYAIEVRNANYGVPFKDVGSLGRCYYLWCKVEEKEGTPYFIQFSEEEENIKKNLLKQYFGTDEEKDILIAQMVDAGEISEAEAYRLTRQYRGLNNAGFMGFLRELERQVGSKVVKATKFERELYFDEKDKPQLLN